MLIDCPACARSYHVSRAEIGEEGRTVVCPQCDTCWFVDCDGTGTLIPPEAVWSSAPASGRIIEHDITRPAPRSRLRPVAAMALYLMAATGLLGARAGIVHLVPRTAGLYAAIGLPVNLRGLEIRTLTPTRTAEAPSDVTLSGEIRNVAQKRVGIPRLAYEIRDAAGVTLANWTERAGAQTLGVGKTLPFMSSPHPLPDGAHSIVVRFEAEDAVKPVRLVHRAEN